MVNEKGGPHEGGYEIAFLKKLLTEDELKELAAKKLDLKVTKLEQHLELTKWIRDKVKSKI